MPKLVADATGVRLTVVLLLAAVGLLIASVGPGRAGLAWGSVALSVVAAGLIVRRWRRSWLQRRDAPEDEIVLLEDAPITDAEAGGAQLAPASATVMHEADLNGERIGQSGEDRPGETQSRETQTGETQTGETQLAEGQPGEEDTDAADLLVVYELTDEVLVVDEQPRYHLARCRLPDHEQVERLPVREARELGFTPCVLCRPDTTLARKHRASRATTTPSS
ncbi:MAG: hypothetical protein ACRDS0_17000 [Pseudonocardiaceae bacterium]